MLDANPFGLGFKGWLGPSVPFDRFHLQRDSLFFQLGFVDGADFRRLVFVLKKMAIPYSIP